MGPEHGAHYMHKMLLNCVIQSATGTQRRADTVPSKHVHASESLGTENQTELLSALANAPTTKPPHHRLCRHAELAQCNYETSQLAARQVNASQPPLSLSLAAEKSPQHTNRNNNKISTQRLYTPHKLHNGVRLMSPRHLR